MVLLLSHKDVDSLLTMESNIKTMEESFIELSKNNVKMTNRGVQKISNSTNLQLRV